MPKISAATVKEHHQQMLQKLVDAAEMILRESGPSKLTAGAVAQAAGIARNSIYRYVGSVDDLRIAVLERYVPLWVKTVRQRVNPDDDARRQLLNLALVSMEMAQTTGHSWLISVMRYGAGKSNGSDHRRDDSPYHSPVVANFHYQLGAEILHLWKQIDPQNAVVKAQLNRALLESGMKLLDYHSDVKPVAQGVCAAISGMFPERGESQKDAEI